MSNRNRVLNSLINIEVLSASLIRLFIIIIMRPIAHRSAPGL